MSRDFRHGFNQASKGSGKKGKREDASAKPVKSATKQRCEVHIRQAMKHRDFEALADYDEYDI